MKNMYLVVALTFGSLSLNAMEHESRVKLSEPKLVKDKYAEYHQTQHRDGIIMISAVMASHVALLASKRIRRGPDARTVVPFLSFLTMGYTCLLYKSVKDYNLAKQGLRWHREIVVE
jgi:hypothetical protein